MMPSITLKQLAHLSALERERHFGRAAEACHVSQSALSASLQTLENQLGAALVDRTKRQVVLTPLGEETVARARRILEAVEDLAAMAAAEQAPLSGTLRLGMIPTIGPFLLPRALPQLRPRYPKLKLYLVEDLTDRLVEALHRGRLDALLVALPWDCGNVDAAHVLDDRFLLACHADHRLAAAEAAEPGEIQADSLLLLREGHCLSDHALSACRIEARRHQEAFEATSLPTLVQMVDNGLGITILPQSAVDAGILRGTRVITRKIAGPVPSREIALVWRKGTARAGEFRLLAEELARHCDPARESN